MERKCEKKIDRGGWGRGRRRQSKTVRETDTEKDKDAASDQKRILV